MKCHGRLVAGNASALNDVVKPLIPPGGRIAIDLGDFELARQLRPVNAGWFEGVRYQARLLPGGTRERDAPSVTALESVPEFLSCEKPFSAASEVCATGVSDNLSLL